MTRVLGGFLFLLAACAEPTILELQADAAARPADASTLYQLRPDQRRCMYPLCGGAWVSAVNERALRCPDNTRDAECYAFETDVQAAADPVLAADAVGLIAQGGFEAVDFSDLGLGTMSRFVTTRVWIAVDDGATAHKVYGASDNGIRCITAPCYSTLLVEIGRNGAQATQTISGLDLSRLDMDAAEADAVWASYDAGTLLVAGTVELDATGGEVLVADEAWY